MNDLNIKKQILNFCVKKGLLLDKDVLNVIEQLGDVNLAESVLEKIEHRCQEKIITKSCFNNNFIKIRSILEDYEGGRKETVEKIFLKLGLNIEITKQKIEETDELRKLREFDNFRILACYNSPPKKIVVQDFVKYFRNRFEFFKSLLQDRSELQNLTAINRITGNRQGISVIGMVLNKRMTKNKNIFIELEDLTGKINVIANQNKPEVYERAKELLLDDIVAIKASGSRDILFANSILFPDCFLSTKKKSSVDESVAFISDIHLGSKMFLEKNFQKFVDWINGIAGDELKSAEAKKVKYLFITGDSIDGVGIFPGQEDVLDIIDIRKQYEKLADFLRQIRKDVQIFLCPGQHDGVRVTEPQPPLGKDFAEPLFEIENLYLVSNPAYVEIGQGRAPEEKFKILMYHGASMHNIINEIEELRLETGHDKPSAVVKHLLKRRHLSPVHSFANYVPYEKDALIIREIPDIIVTGDLHRPDVDMYNNVLMIASSCWQSITPFEEKVGNHPDPCKVPVFNLKTREIKILDFSDGEEEKKKLM